jgi:hypothetical protein
MTDRFYFSSNSSAFASALAHLTRLSNLAQGKHLENYTISAFTNGRQTIIIIA